jgi:hypothetical protein
VEPAFLGAGLLESGLEVRLRGLQSIFIMLGYGRACPRDRASRVGGTSRPSDCFDASDGLKPTPPGAGRVLIFAAAEVHVLLFEPASTLDTGNVRHGPPLDVLERIGEGRPPSRFPP